jgi:cytochrome c553
MRWVGRVALALAGLVFLTAAIGFGGSEYLLRRHWDVPLTAVPRAGGPAAVAEGARLARALGCRDCHGQAGAGGVLLDSPAVGRIAPPALAGVAARYSDAQLVRAIRHGVGGDGQTLFVMPTNAYATLADDDVARLIAWIRSLDARPGDEPGGVQLGPVGRALLVAGKLPASAQVENVSRAHRPADVGGYFVGAVCAACHDLHRPMPAHDGSGTAPALAPIAAAYDPAAFRRLLRTGRGADGRDKGLMGKVARGGLSSFTDAEIAAMQGYLRAEAERGPEKR